MIREKYPYTKVLVVTSLIDPKVLERAKSGCADSLWYKDHGEEDIRSVIYRTLNGERVFPDITPRWNLTGSQAVISVQDNWRCCVCIFMGCPIRRLQGKWIVRLPG